jgi:prepilin-type N-terminal cleavage/methylation domain-containing protein
MSKNTTKTNRTNRAFTIIELLITIIVLCTLLGGAGGLLRGCSQSEGFRAGTVTDLGQKGSVYPTWEGRLLVGQNVTWEFSVSDDKIAGQIKDALLKNQTVALQYTKGYFTWGYRTAYDITGVTVVEKQNNDNAPTKPAQPAAIPNPTHVSSTWPVEYDAAKTPAPANTKPGPEAANDLEYLNK